MSELAYLGLAVILSTIGSIVIWYRQNKVEALDSGIQDFSRALDALHKGRNSQNDDANAQDQQRRLNVIRGGRAG